MKTRIQSTLMLWTVAAIAACTNSQTETLPKNLNPLAKSCYQALMSESPPQRPQLDEPQPMKDGTLLIQWRFSETDYGSCQVDSRGALLLLTSSEPSPEAADSDAASPSSPSEAAQP
ncbi:MAG: hypothetical protein F6J97_24030 [Leptolyngbya sp. SIO4C1]|nr:hypothetical protein [Leptolyngbya sp. SIO4C1]